MRYKILNNIAEIDHRFTLNNIKIKEGERQQEDGTNIKGGGYYCFGYEDKHQRIKVQIDKEIKDFKRAVRHASRINASTSTPLHSRRTNKIK